MIIIETCPSCGYDLVDSVICTYQPIPVKECHRCGWRCERPTEKVVRVPFNEDTQKDLKHILKGEKTDV